MFWALESLSMEMSIQSLFMGITVLIKYDNIRNSTYKHYVLHKFSSIYTQIFIVANVVIPSTHMVRCCLLEMMWNRFQDSYCCSFWATVLLFSHIILILSGIYKMVKFWQHICHIGFAWGNLWSSINSKVEIKNIYIASLFLCISQPGLAHTHTHKSYLYWEAAMVS